MADLEKMILAKKSTNLGGFLNYMTDKYADADKKGAKKGKKQADAPIEDWEDDEEDSVEEELVDK